MFKFTDSLYKGCVDVVWIHSQVQSYICLPSWSWHTAFLFYDGNSGCSKAYNKIKSSVHKHIVTYR